MPAVMIYQSPRSAEAKRKVIGPITEAIVAAYGLRPEQIQIYFHESGPENWGNAGRLHVDSEGSSQSAANSGG